MPVAEAWTPAAHLQLRGSLCKLGYLWSSEDGGQEVTVFTYFLFFKMFFLY